MRGTTPKKEVEILKKIPVDILNQMSHYQLAAIFNISSGYCSQLISKMTKIEIESPYYKPFSINELLIEKNYNTKGAWINSKEREFYQSNGKNKN